jgi:hypothetical protein
MSGWTWIIAIEAIVTLIGWVGVKVSEGRQDFYLRESLRYLSAGVSAAFWGAVKNICFILGIFGSVVFIILIIVYKLILK